MTHSPTDIEPGASKTLLAQLPLVSIVVISYNHAAYLRYCLDSVVSQTYPRLQLIIVDNASTDGSRRVIEDFASDLPTRRADLDLTPIFSRENGHEVGAALMAFPAARGSYLAFVDGDDILLPGCIEAHVQAQLASRIAVGMTSVDMYQTIGDDIVVGTGPGISRFVTSKRGQVDDFCRMANLDALIGRGAFSSAPITPTDLHYVPPSMAHDWVWSPSTGLCFRREAVALMLDPPPAIRAGIDNYLARGVIALTGGIIIDKPLAIYRMHGNNMFTRHPTLANFHAYDPRLSADLDVGVITAIMDCYRRHAAHLAAALVDPDVFINAIDQFAGIVERHSPSGRGSSVALQFLLDNREPLIGAFGPNLYRKWLARRLRPRGPLARLRSRIAAAD